MPIHMSSENPFSWNPCWLNNVQVTRKDPESEWLARDNLETYPITIKRETVSHEAEQSSGASFTFLPTSWALFPDKVCCFVSMCVSLDNSFWSVRREPTLQALGEVPPPVTGAYRIKSKCFHLATFPMAVFPLPFSQITPLSIYCCCCSVTQSYLTLCDSMDCSMLGFLVLHHLPELAHSCPLSRWCHPTISSSVTPPLLLPSIFPSIRVFSNELALCIRWPKYWSFSFIISPSNEYSGLISFRTNWFDLLAVQGSLKSLLQHPIALHLHIQACANSLQSCPTRRDPIDGSPAGSPVPGTLQARTLEWVAISFSNAWKWKVKVKSLSHVQPSVTPWTAAF